MSTHQDPQPSETKITRKTMLQGMAGGAAALAGTSRLPEGMTHAGHSAAARPTVLCWLESDEPASLASLQKHASLITHLSPTWFSMRDDLSIAGSPDPLVVQFAARQGLALHPLIHNDQFDPGVAHRILSTPQRRASAAQRIADLVIQHNFAGINMDFEGPFGADRERYADLIARLATRLRPAGKFLSVDVVPRLSPDAPHATTSWSAPYDYARLGAAADAIVLMAYDYSVQNPGPISPLWWVRGVIAYARSQIPPAKLVIGFPSYGRHWITTTGPPSMTALSQVEAQQLLTWTGTLVTRPAKDATPRFSWRVGNAVHSVHYDDRTSLAAKLQAVDASIGGVAFWRLGKESTWQWELLSGWVRR
jgi:spore germination protein YaaH